MNAYSGSAFKVEAISRDVPVERSTYRRSRRADPFASIAALGVGVAAIAAFAVMSPVLVKTERRDATIVTLMELPDDPPPAVETPPPPQQTVSLPQPAVVAPAPMVTLNTTPVIAAPTPMQQPAPPSPKAAAPVATAPIAKGPETVGDMSAKVVFRRPIRVPLESRRAREEGVVILSVLLAVDGQVSDIAIATSSGSPRLDRAALEAVRDWRWSPLIRDGSAVMVRGLVRIPFIRESGRGDRDGHRGRGHHDGSRGDRFDEAGAPGPDDQT